MKFRKLILFFTSLFILSSCSFFNANNDDKVPEVSFKTYRRNIGYADLPSLGSPKMLVIPVVFKDCELTSDELEIEYNNIVKTFSGEASDTYWESVKSYYYKSSYGKLNLDIKVSDYYYYDTTIIEANKNYVNNRVEPTYDILKNACDWYTKNYSDYNDFDSNNDGYIDSIWMIYMEDSYITYFQKYPELKIETNLEQFLWAYTYWFVDKWQYDFKRPFAYSWASYKFLYSGTNSNGTDAHTLIHETGHLLGLEDYYNYDFSTSLIGDRTKPCGALDMMDNNVLDHNAYSKYLLNWINPTICKDGTYTLDSFQNNGDALIIKTTENNSPLDEYLIIEYYTPTGLNELDSKFNYNIINSGFTESGFKIYHVDSRLGLFHYEKRSLKFDSYYEDHTNYFNDASENLIQIANSNTPSRSANKKNKLVTLLSPLGKSRLYFVGPINLTADNRDLFQTGDKIEQFTFNSYEDSDLLIEVIDSNDQNGTIKISGVGK